MARLVLGLAIALIAGFAVAQVERIDRLEVQHETMIRVEERQRDVMERLKVAEIEIHQLQTEINLLKGRVR